jgi:AcrR family transcriptional regulator
MAVHPKTRHEPDREAVLDAAEELLVTRGLTAMTIEAVAAKAGVEVAAINRWWPSEEALAVDVLQYEWLALATRIRRRAHVFGL